MRLTASALLLGLANAADVTYVTDLPIATSLAACAFEVISVQFSLQNNSPCPTDATQFQSCVCTQQFKNISWSISDRIQDYCGGTSTGDRDQSSAMTVLEAYCNQDTTYTFETPQHPVTSYIYELDAFTRLASCAQIPLRSVVNTWMGEYLCPSYRSGLAPCACEKEIHSTQVTSGLDDLVEKACGSVEDVAAAKSVFAAYCRLNSEITSATGNSNPTGSAGESASRRSTSRPSSQETGSSSASDDGSTSNDGGGNSSGLATGAIAGVVVGCAVFAVGLLGVMFLLIRRRRKTKASNLNTAVALNYRDSMRSDGDLPPDDGVAPPAYEAGDFGKRFQREQGQN